MFKFVYDRRGPYGFVPNLLTDTSIMPGSQQWYARQTEPPYSNEFRFRDYLSHEDIQYQEISVDHYSGDDGIYPVHLDYFDSDIDYLSLIRPETLDLARRDQLTILFYLADGQDPVQQAIPRLDYLADLHQIPRENIKTITSNAYCEKYDDFVFFPDAEIRYAYLNRHSHSVSQVNVGHRPKKFTFLNTTDQPWSRLFAASLWYHGMHVESHFVYPDSTHREDFENSSVWRWHACWEKPRRLAETFSIHLPFRPEPANEQSDPTVRLYTESYWNLVPESYHTKEDLSLSDRTFAAILNMQPFIILGPPGSLKLLRDLGYKTFGNFIDESYDVTQNDEKRLYKCFQLAFYLYNLPHEEHQSLMRLVEPALEHNRKVLLSSKKNMLLHTLNKIR
jgi:hypothetical protein